MKTNYVGYVLVYCWVPRTPCSHSDTAPHDLTHRVSTVIYTGSSASKNKNQNPVFTDSTCPTARYQTNCLVNSDPKRKRHIRPKISLSAVDSRVHQTTDQPTHWRWNFRFRAAALTMLSKSTWREHSRSLLFMLQPTSTLAFFLKLCALGLDEDRLFSSKNTFTEPSTFGQPLFSKIGVCPEVLFSQRSYSKAGIST